MGKGSGTMGHGIDRVGHKQNSAYQFYLRWKLRKIWRIKWMGCVGGYDNCVCCWSRVHGIWIAFPIGFACREIRLQLHLRMQLLCNCITKEITFAFTNGIIFAFIVTNCIFNCQLLLFAWAMYICMWASRQVNDLVERGRDRRSGVWSVHQTLMKGSFVLGWMCRRSPDSMH